MWIHVEAVGRHKSERPSARNEQAESQLKLVMFKRR
jgi:hypothetical protein